MQQHEREMCVGALLDITLDQYRNWMIAAVDTGEVENIPDEVQRRVAPLAEGLLIQKLGFDPDLPTEAPVVAQDRAKAMFLQSICLMSDDTLLMILNMITGTNPLEV